MSDDRQGADQLRQELEVAFLDRASIVDSAAGEVRVGEYPLETFISERFGEEWAEEAEDFETVDEFLEYVTGHEPERLLTHEIRNQPIGWFWYLSAFHIGDRGYLYVWNEPDLESGTPILASWRPYASDQVFANAFVAAHRVVSELLYVWIGDWLERSPRVSRELLEEALSAALTSHDGWEDFENELNLRLNSDEERMTALRKRLAEVDKSKA